MKNISIPIIVKNQTFTPNSKEYEFYTGGGYQEYLTNEKLHPFAYPDGSLDQQLINAEEAKQNGNSDLEEELFAKYLAREGKYAGKSGAQNLKLFDKYGDNVSPNAKNIKFKPKSNVYSLVISFSPEISQTMLLDDARAKIVANKVFNTISNFNPALQKQKDFNYFAILHNHNNLTGDNKMNHTHIHMLIYQNEDSLLPPIDKVILSPYSLSMVKWNLINSLNEISPENKEKVYDLKLQLQSAFKKAMNEKQIQSINNNHNTIKHFKELASLQAQIYKLFKAQPEQNSYIDKKTKELKTINGRALTYDNLLKPSIDPKSPKKKARIQPIQFAFKEAIDNYAIEVIKNQKTLNKTNKEFNNYLNDLSNSYLNLMQKDTQKDTSDKKIVNNWKNRVLNEVQTNLGNSIIKTIGSFNSASGARKLKYFMKIGNNDRTTIINAGFKKYSNLISKNNKHTSNSTKNTPILNVLNSTDQSALMIAKSKQKMKIEENALEQEITVEELLEKIRRKKTN